MKSDKYLEELKMASAELYKFWKERCMPHEAILVDCYGVKVVSDEVFLAQKQLAEIDEPLK